MVNDKKYCSLQESTYWIAFGTTTPPAQVVLEQEQVLNKAKENLFDMLVAGLLIPTGIQMELKPTDYLPKYHKSERKKFKVHQSIFLDIVENSIFDAYIDDNKHVQCNQFKFMTDIEIDFNELKKHFPPKQDDTNTKKRPVSRQIHDIVYYFWENNPNLSVKQISDITNYVIVNFFPEIAKGKNTVKLNTVRTWRSEFSQGKYTPAIPKHKISKQYRGIFQKLNDAI
ncbi:MAG: hypothetical protein IKW57_01860 [Alphaproteobacteria bacterium]|nr:hypothetical protein [Alphaproteobacteria bacterium]